jgi:hypothetical protein
MLEAILSTLELIGSIDDLKSLFQKPMLGIFAAFLLIAGLPITACLILR